MAHSVLLVCFRTQRLEPHFSAESLSIGSTGIVSRIFLTVFKTCLLVCKSGSQEIGSGCRSGSQGFWSWSGSLRIWFWLSFSLSLPSYLLQHGAKWFQAPSGPEGPVGAKWGREYSPDQSAFPADHADRAESSQNQTSDQNEEERGGEGKQRPGRGPPKRASE